VCQRLSIGRFNDQHCLTSPTVQSCKSIVIVKTHRKSAPFRDGPKSEALSVAITASAFAFSGFFYPLSCSPSLRSGYRCYPAGLVGLTQL
jgi:hypothetical protein